ncbi:MAG: amidase, partial [Gammaproteobacteria bacterium]|nr:amidase [Gammaproteobacteria bacterium]
MSKPIHWMSAHELSRAYADQSLSPVEVTRHLLDRIDQLNPQLNCFCYLAHHETLAQAEASEKRWATSTPLSPLDGVPVSIKDQILTLGWPTLRGSKAVDPSGPWNEDAPVCARFREAGLVLLGKTNTSEFGWRGSTDTLLCGVTRNPWNLELTPGGSSGGAASAIAAGLGPLAVGSDGGGSVRIPASLTGVFGMKPHFGRVPSYPRSFMGSLAHLGPLTRDVRDATALLNIMQKPDKRDPDALPYSNADFDVSYNGTIQGLNIAYSETLGYVDYIKPDVVSTINTGLSMVEASGNRLTHVDAVFSNPVEHFIAFFAAGTIHFFNKMTTDQFSLLEEPLKKFVSDCKLITQSDFMKALDGRELMWQQMNTFFEKYDLLLTPTVATTAFEAGQVSPKDENGEDWRLWSPFTFPFNVTGHPTASINCGFTESGLPVGLQIIGRPHDEATVLAAAYAFEKKFALT